MNFKPVSIDHYKILKPFFSENPYSLSVYSPASIIAWSYRTFKADYAIDEGNLYICGYEEDHPLERHLILPVSSQKISFTPSMLYDTARKTGFDLYWYVPGDYLETLDSDELKSLFLIEEQPGFKDYVYLTEDLIHLRGNRFSKKRNLINQFTREYLRRDRVKVDEIRPEDVDECLQFLELWCDQHDCDTEQESSLACEKHAVITTLKNMARLESNLNSRELSRPVVARPACWNAPDRCRLKPASRKPSMRIRVAPVCARAVLCTPTDVREELGTPADGDGSSVGGSVGCAARIGGNRSSRSAPCRPPLPSACPE